MPSNYIPAGLLKRWFAHLLDILILSIITIVVGSIPAIIYSLLIETDEIPEHLGYGLLFVISWLYYTLMEMSPKQATIGKQAMGIFVTDLNGDRLSFQKSGLRNCSKIILIFLGNFTWIAIFFSSKRQAFHDIIVGTMVMEKSKNKS